MNGLRMEEFTATSTMNPEYFRAAWLKYISYYYYSYELETALPLRATPFLWLAPVIPLRLVFSSDISFEWLSLISTKSFFF